MSAKARRALVGTRLRPVGVIRSALKARGEAPKQGSEGAPDAWLEVRPWAAEALRGLSIGDEIVVITWLHRARRDVLKVHPRSDAHNPLTGVFATRSPDRPNPLGLHRESASAPKKRTGMLINASACTAMTIRETDSSCPATKRSWPVGWKIIVIRVPTVPPINAMLPLRSSVTNHSLELEQRAVRAKRCREPEQRAVQCPGTRRD